MKRAKTEDLTDIAALRCLYRTGVDRYGRPVVVFVGKHLDASKVDLERVIIILYTCQTRRTGAWLCKVCLN